eukprot:1151373-Rhodomonas_salina.2
MSVENSDEGVILLSSEGWTDSFDSQVVVPVSILRCYKLVHFSDPRMFEEAKCALAQPEKGLAIFDELIAD